MQTDRSLPRSPQKRAVFARKRNAGPLLCPKNLPGMLTSGTIARPGIFSDDIIDDFTPSPPRFVRLCCAKGCRENARLGGRYCKQHHAGASRDRHERQRTVINAKRRDDAAKRTDEERIADTARAKLAMALKRGKLMRSHCVVCGSSKTTAYIADPVQWRTVIWVCRDHRGQLVDDIVDRERQLRKRNEQAARREHFLVIFNQLPANLQATVRDCASRDPFGIRPLTEEAPLYWHQLIRETEKLYTLSAT